MRRALLRRLPPGSAEGRRPLLPRLYPVGESAAIAGLSSLNTSSSVPAKRTYLLSRAKKPCLNRAFQACIRDILATYRTDDKTKKTAVKTRLDPMTPLTVVIGPSFPTIAFTSIAAMTKTEITKPRLSPDIAPPTPPA